LPALDERIPTDDESGDQDSVAAARNLLAEGGALVDQGSEVVKIQEKTARAALQTAPSTFHLFDRLGEAKVTYGGNTVQFDPGSSAVHVLDPDTLEHRSPKTADLVRIVKVAEMLPQYDAQSTAVVCDDVQSRHLYAFTHTDVLGQPVWLLSNYSLQAADRHVGIVCGVASGLWIAQAVFDVIFAALI
jgi:trimethylamine:corrinoid methyltransferase-like protein